LEKAGKKHGEKGQKNIKKELIKAKAEPIK